MVSLLMKSKYLIFFNVIIALFSTLSFSVFLSMYERAGRLHDGLSQDSMLIRINSLQFDSDEALTVNDFLNILKETSSEFLLYRDNGVMDGPSARSFYLYNRELPLEIAFLQTENNHVRSVIMDEMLLPNARYEASNHYFFYRGYEYKVIGTFQHAEVIGGADFFTEIDVETSILGIYAIDGLTDEHISEVVRALQTLNSDLVVEFMPLERTFTERMLIVLQVSFFVIISMLLALFFIGLGTLTHTVVWLELRKNEINARYLVGATTKHIQRWLLKEYFFIISGSFVLGCVLAFLIWKIGVFRYIMPYFHLLGVGLAFILCLILGLLTEGISVQLNGRRKGVLRKESTK